MRFVSGVKYVFEGEVKTLIQLHVPVFDIFDTVVKFLVHGLCGAFTGML